MKKLWLSAVLLLVVLLRAGLPDTSHAAPYYNKYASPINVLARGAATPDELAKSLLLAIQENNTSGLNAFLLDEKEMVLLKNKGSEDMKAFLENRTATDLQDNFRRNYQTLVEQGVSQTINWSEYAVSEARLGKGSAKNAFLQPLTVLLTNNQQQSVELLLETIKLNNRYYLFRQLELKSQKKI
ncbi:hypothetical protein [Adhaeribacter rhizoryzae]|uniref:DUF4252 domain-containing protein n=1 Tax=Adhaeribacter rhizoryzae TaxID=2607907 RepID=A0A5M6DQD9_9BACT|nr:hypothetical protein [Adhaeribacter rhizoryzae]KAA5548400.1 hypothetical protein F0145_06640 [Adhaeribacter rhizoryzae]